MGLLRTLPDWRVALVWRLYGWAGIQQVLILSGSRSWPYALEHGPWSFKGFALCAVLLAAFGPRPAVLIATAFFSSAMLLVTASGTNLYLNFPGAELPLFAAMPVGSVLLWACRRWSGEEDEGEDLTRSLLSLYKIAFVVEMGFAALHKMNRDFLDPEITCASVLSEMLPQWWNSPVADLGGFLVPPVVLAFEGGIPLLAILYWPVGLLVMLGFMLGLAMVGPTGFTAVSIAAGFGFVRGTTSADFYGVLRRRPGLVVLGLVALVAYVAFAHRAPPQYPWSQFALYAVIVSLLSVCLLGEIWRDLRGERSGGFVAALRLEWPRAASLRAVLVLILLLGIGNGLTPYFGYKYHFSFSMLSNLRADGGRWNSLVVPRWFRLVDEDPFVEVRRIVIDREHGREVPPERELFEAHWPPYEFVRRVRYHLYLGHELDLDVRYEGVDWAFPDVRSSEEAKTFLAGLPRTLLFQKVLVEGPQPCVH